MIKDITIPAKLCQCCVCDYKWVSTAINPPESCRNRQCRSREWDGKTQKSHVNEIKLPVPRRQGRPKTITLIEDSEI